MIDKTLNINSLFDISSVKRYLISKVRWNFLFCSFLKVRWNHEPTRNLEFEVHVYQWEVQGIYQD